MQPQPALTASIPSIHAVTTVPHDVAAATRWFAQWSCYRAIVDHDWMSHAAIAAAIRADLLRTRPDAFTVLDLGCGDADPAIRALAGTAAASYVGVDASPAALAEARRRLAETPYATELVVADAVADVAARAAGGMRTDVVLAGYLVHHFPPAIKRTFFADVRRVLAPGGTFYFFDIHRLPGTTREAYLTAYVEGMRGWQPLTAEAFAATCEHVLAHDFPETEEFILQAAADAGFDTAGSLLVADRAGFHRLHRFTPGAAPR
jgi:SAM-dependent methyltransferase